MKLPNGTDRASAQRYLDLYDMRRRGGYKNQIIAARNQATVMTGMTIRDLRKWLRDNP